MSRDAAFIDLLTDLHQSLERLAEDLSRDRPALANALRRESAWIPRPDEVRTKPAPPPPASPTRAVRDLRPLLYRALDEGIVSARRFDALMVRHMRARRAMRQRT
jgi:hypothetical protein